MDVAQDQNITDCFAQLSQTLGKIWWFSFTQLCFAPADQLDGDYVAAATREGFRIAHDISAYSFVAMAQAARPFLILTQRY